MVALKEKRKVAFHSLGCKANLYDTVAIQHQVNEQPLLETTRDHATADVVVINSCAVTDRATREARQLAYQAKRRNPHTKVVLTGCYVDSDGDQVVNNSAFDVIAGNGAKENLAALLGSDDLEQKIVSVPDVRKIPKFFHEHVSSFNGRTRAFIKVQDGCNNFCTFCIIPLTRGRSRSLPFEQIQQQIRKLIASGYQEMVLTGIDLGAYGKDLKPRQNLSSLMHQIADLSLPVRIRISSLDPEDLSDECIEIIKQSPMFAKHLHLPLQSGDNEILKLMRRSYTREEFVEAVNKVSQSIPDCGIGTDIITGFPGETQDHFNNTKKILEELPISYAHVFPYSPKKGTKAASFTDQVPPKLARDRCRELVSIATQKRTQFAKQQIGKPLTILTETCADDQSNMWIGYSDNYVQCSIHASAPNQFVSGTGHQVTPETLEVTLG